MSSFYDAMEANRRNSYILILVVLAVAFSAVYAFSYLLFEDEFLGLLIGVPFSLFYVGATYFFADRAVLALGGAREAKKGEFPHLVNSVEGLSIAAGIPAPKIYVIDDPGMNAFATGNSPESASVAFTTGLISKLDRVELEGVVAHELSHIKNYDSRMATLVIVMIGLIALLSDIGLRHMFWGRGERSRGGRAIALAGLLMMVLAPFIAQIVRLALSRQREYLADATGAQISRYPEGLASALEKIAKNGSMVRTASDTTAPLYFANPLSFSGFFSTHPPVEDRVRRLREM